MAQNVMNKPALDFTPVLDKCPFEQRVLTIRQRRLDAFFKTNPHLQNVVVVQGSRGDQLDRNEMVAAGLITSAAAESEKTTAGMIGHGHSIWRLCMECVAKERPILIMEDDVKTHPEIYEFLTANKEQLLAKEFVALSFNTDAPAAWKTEGGLIHSTVFEPRFPDYEWIERYFQKTPVESIKMHKLLCMFGTCCFLLMPSGAQKILSLGYPLTLETTPIPFLKHPMPGVSIDRRLNAIYKNIDAGICIPPVALSPNDKSTSEAG